MDSQPSAPVNVARALPLNAVVVAPAEVRARSIAPLKIKLGISTWTSPTLELLENCQGERPLS